MVVNKPLMTPYFWGESIAKAQVFAFSAWWRFDRRPRVATWDAELAARGCRFPAACLWLHQSGCTETLGASQAEYQAAPLKINNQDERQSWRFGSGWFFFVNGSFLGSSRSFSRVYTNKPVYKIISPAASHPHDFGCWIQPEDQTETSSDCSAKSMPLYNPR